MSIDAIDSVSSLRRPSALDMYNMFLNQAPYPQPAQSSNASPLAQQLMSMLVTSLLSAAQQSGQGLSTSGPGGSGNEGWPGGAGTAGSLPGTGGLTGPSSTGNSSPLSGNQGVLNSLLQLLQALLPLLQALSQNGMQPNGAAGPLGNQLGGGGGGGSSAGPSAGSGGGSPFGGTGNSGGGNGGSPWDSNPTRPSLPPLNIPSTANTSSPWSPTSSSSTPSTPSTPGSTSTFSAPSSPGTPSSPSTPATQSAPVGAARPTEMPPAAGTVVVNDPIVVKAGQTFDGGGKLYQAGAALGDGGRSEGQKPVFILEDGATLKNLQIAGADGVHVYGDANIQNVWWKDVGEDALSKKKEGDVKITGGGAFNAHDKIFTATAGGSLSIDGFTAENFGRLVATDHRYVPPRNDGTFPLEVSITNSRLTNGDEVFRTDAANARVTFNNNEMNDINYDARGPSGMEVIGGQKVGRVEGAVI